MTLKTQQSRSQQAAELIRNEIINGDLKPQTRLSEVKLCERLSVSRNTLRESFRLLSQEGILNHIPNRGVYVSLPDQDAVRDIYRLRRLLESEAIASAYPHHPGFHQAQAAIKLAKESQAAEDWQQVGTANILFHNALVSLADSERFNQIHQNICVELRLAFSSLTDQQMLHGPYIERNEQIFELIENEQYPQAIKLLQEYLDLSLRTVLGALSRAH